LKLTALLFVLTYPCFATEPVAAVRVYDPPAVNGALDDPAWDLAVATESMFVQTQPNFGEPMSEETEIRVVYDDKFIYFAFIMHDGHPEDFLRMVAPRDTRFSSEWVGLWLDTFNDDNNAYFFYVNVDNVQRDGRLSEVGGWDENWDGIWESATAVTDSGWIAELAIPFSDLRYAKREKQTWGMNVNRTITRTNEKGYLYPMENSFNVDMEKFGDLVGLENLPQSGNTRFWAYGAGRLRYMPGNKDEYDPWANSGLDARLSLSSQMALDLTVNPDFGQVESDPDQVNLSHWETYLSEKRAFFLEGSDMFNMPFNLFYSRRIGSVAPNGELIPILGGAKLTGLAGGFRVGFMDAFTGKVREGDSVIVRHTNYTAGRLVREFGSGTYLGACLTSADIPAEDSLPYVYGRAGALDGRLHFLDFHSLSASVAGTWNSTDTVWEKNVSYNGEYDFNTDKLGFECGFERSGENFDANMMGYTSATGFLKTWTEAGYFYRTGNSPIFRGFNGNLDLNYTEIPGGPVTNRSASLSLGAMLRNMYNAGITFIYKGSHTDVYEGPEGMHYEGGPGFLLRCFTDHRKPLYGNIRFFRLPYCEGTNVKIGTEIGYKPFPNISTGLSLDWNTTENAKKYNRAGGEWGYRDTDWRSVTLKAGMMFTNELGLRVSSQLSRFEFAWDSGNTARRINHRFNALLTWRFRPGSTFYFMLGENADPDPKTGDPGEPEFTAFAKLSWLLFR